MSKLISRKTVLDDIANFCKEQSITKTEFGMRAVSNGAFVGRIEKGQSPGLETLERAYKFMAKPVTKELLDDLCS